MLTIMLLICFQDCNGRAHYPDRCYQVVDKQTQYTTTNFCDICKQKIYLVFDNNKTDMFEFEIKDVDGIYHAKIYNDGLWRFEWKNLKTKEELKGETFLKNGELFSIKAYFDILLKRNIPKITQLKPEENYILIRPSSRIDDNRPIGFRLNSESKWADLVNNTQYDFVRFDKEQQFYGFFMLLTTNIKVLGYESKIQNN